MTLTDDLPRLPTRFLSPHLRLMLPLTYLPCTRQSTAAWLCHTRPADALQRRRRAVLFAFTFSPPSLLA